MTTYKTGYGKFPVAIIFATAFLYQVFCAIRGFDMTDEGFLMGLFQFFGENPSACPGGAGYPLSCYLGWLVQSVWPAGGILWVRLAGVILVTATMYVSYRIIRKFTGSGFALAGLLLQVIFLTTDPKPFGYNNLSAFFYISSIALIVRAETSRRYLPLVLSGLIAGLGVFLRLPNLAFLGLCILPLFSSGINFKGIIRCIIIAGSFVAGVACGWLILKAIGADGLVLGFFSSLGGTLDGESTHSSTAMLMTYLSNYFGSLKQLILVSVVILITSLLLRCKKAFWPLIILPLWVLYWNFYIDSGILNDNTIMLYNGIGLVGCALSFKKDSRLNVIPAAAILLSLLAPLGSDKGFTTMWTGTWLSLPVGLAGICRRFSKEHDKYRLPVLLCIIVISAAAFLSSFRHPYYDGGSRFRKTASIESIYARGIRTKPEQAAIINGVLSAMENEGIKERDTILVFDSSPMLYYLTRTVAFDGLYWPCLQYGDQYVGTLNQSVKNNPLPRAVIIQNFFNLGNGTGWDEPDIKYTCPAFDGAMATKNMKKAVFEFIKDSHYTKSWSNGYYDIYVL